jgi:FkbM family methyltransferase
VTGRDLILTIRPYLLTVRAYARESRTPRDFLRLLRVRLSQSKLGPLVCPRRITVEVDLRTVGSSTWLRSHTTDVAVLGEVLEARSYDPFARAAAGDVRTIVDLGANTGLAARWLLERFPSARLVAVEPHPGNVAVLKQNLRTYGDRAKVVAACIGASERRVALAGTREDGYRIVENGGEIPVVTMETVFSGLGGRRIDMLKVDIEGSEEELFADCSSWIERVGLVSVECHHPFSGEALLSRLAESGVAPRLVASQSAFDYDMVVVDLS